MLVAQCPDRESLHAFSTGRLSSEQTDEIAAHIESCSEFLTELTTLADDSDSLVIELRAPVNDDFLQEPAFGVAVAEARTLLHRVRETGEHASSPAPRVLGEYELLEELGRGGMGRVYKARHTKLDRIVAVKILPSGRLENPQAIARFEREMRAIGGLDHPHIVRAYDGREIEQMPVLVMEYVDGRDLAEVVQRLGRLKPADACELVRQAAAGLQYAHTKGLVHRDIKPSNLMLTRDGVVKVLDLGLARFYVDPTGEEVTGAGQAMGTADYIAPEQVGDSRAADIRSDIYSLGCTLYKLLSGKAPYTGRRGGAVDKMNAHVSEPLPPIEEHVAGLPAQLLTVLKRMTAKRPEERFATPGEVIESLGPLCIGADMAQVFAEAEQVSVPAEEEFGNDDAAGYQNVSLAPQSQRRKPWPLLIALGLLPCMLGIGFAAGVMLTIYKNGQETKFELPDGAHASVDARGDVAVTVPEAASRTASDALDKTVADDLAKLQGRWSAVSVNVGGEEESQEDLREWAHVWTFRGNVLSHSNAMIPASETAGPSQVQLGPAQTPKAIDSVYENARRNIGIYRLRNGQLEVAFSHNDQRPIDFAPGPTKTVWLLQRIAEDEAAASDDVGRDGMAGASAAVEQDGENANAELAELRRLREQNQLQERMIEMLKDRLSYAARTVKLPDPTPKTAAEHAEALMSAVNRRHQEGAALDLAAAEEDVYHRTVETLFEAIDSKREVTQRSAVNSLTRLFQIVPHRMDRYADRFVDRIVPLLSHESLSLVDRVTGALAILGPAGRPALETLQQIVADPQSEHSLRAAITVAAIDPSIDIVPQLLEIIEERRHDWLTAIYLLPDYAPPAQARRILDDLYAKLDTPEHRQVIERALLRIPDNQQTSPAEAGRGEGDAAAAQGPESIDPKHEAMSSGSKQDR